MLSAMRRDWNYFWFEPSPSNSFGLLRLAIGLLAMIAGLQLWPDRFAWFSEHGVLPTPLSDYFNVRAVDGPRPLNLFHVFHPDWFITLFFVLFIAATFLMTIGLWSRLATLLVYLGLNVIHTRNAMVNTTGGDCVMLCMSFFLLLGPCGASCSVDRLLRVLAGKEGDEPPPFLPWPIRLAQLQVVIIYATTFLAKTRGQMWQNGMAMYYPYSLPEFHRFPIPFIDANHIWLINLLTYGALAIEFALASLIFVPRLRLYVIAAGIVLHLGIEYSMNIPLFGWLMMASYLAFIKQRDIRNLCAWLPKTLNLTPLRLVYDGECDFCRSILLVIRFFDVFRLVRFLDYHRPDELLLAGDVAVEQAEEAAIAVDVRGRQYAGYYAFRQVCRRVPMFASLLVIMYLPGIPALGERIYRWITENRSHLPVAGRYRVHHIQAAAPDEEIPNGSATQHEALR